MDTPPNNSLSKYPIDSHQGPHQLKAYIEKTKPQVTAQIKLMDYLARRDHSEQELREKLFNHKNYNFTLEQIDAAIEHAYESNWILPEEDLAQKIANRLHRKKKGALFINNYLEKKGLPNVACDKIGELKKAYSIIESKFQTKVELEWPDRKKAFRLLANRGFFSEVIWKALDLLKVEKRAREEKEKEIQENDS